MNKPHVHAEYICAKANGSDIQEQIAGTLNWVDMGKDDWEFLANYAYRIKPEPVYPKTNFTYGDLQQMWAGYTHGIAPFFTFVANAAIRRAIQDGDVILPEGKA